MTNLSNLDLYLLRRQSEDYDFLISNEGQLLNAAGDNTNIFFNYDNGKYAASIKNSRADFKIMSNAILETLFLNLMVQMFGLYDSKVDLPKITKGNKETND